MSPIMRVGERRGAALGARRSPIPDAAFIAGGTDLLQLFKQGGGRAGAPDRHQPPAARPLSSPRPIQAAYALHIGALARLGRRRPAPRGPAQLTRLSPRRSGQRVAAGAQLATVGGNLLQRTRCGYFRSPDLPCNKRAPGSGCAARSGENRLHAIFGASLHCMATHASDLAVALLALEAGAVRRHEAGHVLPIAELFRLPGDTPQRDNALEPGELIVAVEVPAAGRRRSCYLNVRDRASFEFAVVSVAVALEVEDDVIRSARLAAGGVGTVPWGLAASEPALVGARAEPAAFEAAVAHAADGAEPLGQNGFKIELLRRTVRRALDELTNA